MIDLLLKIALFVVFAPLAIAEVLLVLWIVAVYVADKIRDRL